MVARGQAMDCDEDGLKRWVCPSDRELTLRAKLRTGWSSRTNTDPTSGINENELAMIAQVLDRANRAQEIEVQRTRKLTERLEKIKKQARGTGKKGCALCDDKPGFFSKFYTCKDCHSSVCFKCSVDTFEVGSDSPIWLCKICSEYREVLKKTNLWTQLPNVV